MAEGCFSFVFKPFFLDRLVSNNFFAYNIAGCANSSHLSLELVIVFKYKMPTVRGSLRIQQPSITPRSKRPARKTSFLAGRCKRGVKEGDCFLWLG